MLAACCRTSTPRPSSPPCSATKSRTSPRVIRRSARPSSVLANILAIGAAIATGSGAIARASPTSAPAPGVQGYGRETEFEADRLGMKYADQGRLRPEAMADMFEMFKAQESFEIARARAEGREPRVYHGVFSVHPTPDARVMPGRHRLRQARSGARPVAGSTTATNYMRRPSTAWPTAPAAPRASCATTASITRIIGITMAFPRGWIDREPARPLLAYTAQGNVMQITVERSAAEPVPARIPASTLGARRVRHRRRARSPSTAWMAIPCSPATARRSTAAPARPLDRAVSAAAARSSSPAPAIPPRDGKPEADGIFRSVAQTMRSLKPRRVPADRTLSAQDPAGHDRRPRLAEYAAEHPGREVPQGRAAS